MRSQVISNLTVTYTLYEFPKGVEACVA